MSIRRKTLCGILAAFVLGGVMCQVANRYILPKPKVDLRTDWWHDPGRQDTRLEERVAALAPAMQYAALQATPEMYWMYRPEYIGAIVRPVDAAATNWLVTFQFRLDTNCSIDFDALAKLVRNASAGLSGVLGPSGGIEILFFDRVTHRVWCYSFRWWREI